METFHLYHLAACWAGRLTARREGAPPLTTTPVQPVMTGPTSAAPGAHANSLLSGNATLRAAGAQMVFASRLSQDFITPEQVTRLESWTGKVGNSPEFVPQILTRRVKHQGRVGCAGWVGNSS